MTLTCDYCGTLAPDQGVLNAHVQRRHMGLCPACRGVHALDDAGRLVQHDVEDARCLGTGLAPTPWVRRDDDYGQAVGDVPEDCPVCQDDTHSNPACAQHRTIVRAKGAIDGATTLEDAARDLEVHARALRAMAADGWELTGPVRDDYGWVRRAQPADRG